MALIKNVIFKPEIVNIRLNIIDINYKNIVNLRVINTAIDNLDINILCR